jgi:hypothetical protein
MTIWQILMLTSGALAGSTIGGQAGPCSDEIYRMEARVEARLHARAATGPTADESPEALLHRQPMPGSIAAAESRLGISSPQTIDAITQAMARAREADRAGDVDACARALAEVQSAIGP